MKHRTLITILLILCLIFIWGNSFLNQSVSSSESGFVMKIATPVLELVFGKGNITDHLVRKIAHFLEYVILGLVIASIPKKRTAKNYSVCALSGFGIAFLDETIQIFSNRGPAILDVWIDFAGVLVGLFLMVLIRALSR